MNQNDSLRYATLNALRNYGLGVLRDPHRFIAYVTDTLHPDSRIMGVLYHACDTAYLELFAKAAESGTAAALREAIIRASARLSYELSMDERAARNISYSIGMGTADYLGLRLGIAPEGTTSGNPMHAPTTQVPVNANQAVRPPTPSPIATATPAMSAHAPTNDASIAQNPSNGKGIRLPLPLVIASCVITLVVGVGAGALLLPRIGISSTSATSVTAAETKSDKLTSLGRTKVSEDELDTIVAEYEFRGETARFTAREVLKFNTTLESSKDDEGKYTLPSADDILSYGRNKALATVAKAEGIEVSQAELEAYAQEMLGTSDFDAIASSYNISTEDAKNTLLNSATVNKLREKVTGAKGANDTPAPEAPAAPAAKETKGANNEVKKEYADYIIKLAGDEWDAEKGAFKSPDGPYATALADYKVTKDGASYDAAQAAYYVAYQQYSRATNQTTAEWTDYVNELLADVRIELLTLTSDPNSDDSDAGSSK